MNPGSNQETILAPTPEDQLAEILGGWDGMVMVGGHTHIWMVRRHDRAFVVNAGSVGLAGDVRAAPGHFPHPPCAEWAMVAAASGNQTDLTPAALILKVFWTRQ